MRANEIWRVCLADALSRKAWKSEDPDPLFLRAITSVQSECGVDSVEAAVVFFEYENFLESQNRDDEAAAMRSRLRVILRRFYRRENRASEMARIREFNRAVGAALIILRCANSLTCFQLSMKANLAPESVQEFESGSKTLRVHDLYLLAPLLRTTPARLLEIAEHILTQWVGNFAPEADYSLS